MNHIHGLPTFHFPAENYQPRIHLLPDKYPDFDARRLSKAFVGGLSEAEISVQEPFIRGSNVLSCRIQADNIIYNNLQVNFNGDFVIRYHTGVVKTRFDEIATRGDDWYILTICRAGDLRLRVDHREHIYAGPCSMMARFEDGLDYVTYFVANEPFAYLDICFRHSLLSGRLGISKQQLDNILHPAGMSETCRYISVTALTPKMMNALNELDSIPMDALTFRMFAESKALELLSWYLLERKNQAERCADDKPASSHAGIQQLNRAKNIVREHYQDPPDLEQLSNLVGLSRSRLTRGFKAHFGETVYEYIQRYRMEQARLFFLNHHLNVHDVAGLVGYNDMGSFRKVFQRHFGVLPGKYLTDLR